MKHLLGIIVLVVISALMLGCSHPGNSFQELQGETKRFDAHFPDMDTNGDKLVSWAEFKNQFPDADKYVFDSCDLGKDGNIDHEEWHKIKTADLSKTK